MMLFYPKIAYKLYGDLSKKAVLFMDLVPSSVELEKS